MASARRGSIGRMVNFSGRLISVGTGMELVI